ncbi:MAG: Hsp20/alpha crystallin family protein [Parasporobacterium sp.]|nr:Hsp20/alpha crystallin family protein [Parasporobacterium sp.]
MYLTKRENKFFDDFFKAPFWSNSEVGTNTKIMKTDVQETDTEYIISMDLPGFNKENIQVDLKDGYLTVSASKTVSDEEQYENGKYIRKERFEGSCKRSFFIGEYANEENIKASYNNGVLKLEVPKEPEVVPEPPKRITIQ